MNIIGHKKQREYLQELARKTVLPQSFLFTGPRGIGKKLVALEFASVLIGDSVSDSLVSHPDILLISSEKEEEKGKVKKKKISIESIRQASLFLSRYPAQGRRRVFIVDEAEELTLEASNALLKILEEPNETSVLILITHQPGALLPTIHSRVLTFAFDPVSSKELEERFGPPTKKIPAFFYALGIPALLERAQKEEEAFLQGEKRILAKLFQVSTLSLRERLTLAEELAQDEEKTPLYLEQWLIGMHLKLQESEDPKLQKKLLELYDRLSGRIVSLSKREGNTRLLLEEMFLSL